MEQFIGCEWRLLFRATRDGFTTKEFHDICDGKENTVCFVRTEFDHVCGGFVEKAWSSALGGYTEWAQNCPQAFMFVLRPTVHVFEQTKKRKCSVGHYHGDAWGFGYNDLVLNNGKTGSCRVNGNYHFSSAEQVAGGTYFKYTDYEVFQLVSPK